jgi:uncharacterized protein involved in exopolysaccharide biosynthesis
MDIQATQPTLDHDAEVGFGALAREVWRGKLIVAAAAIVCAGVGTAIGLLAPKQYEASLMVSPVLEDSGSGRLGGLGSLAAQYGGLASLAGLSLPGRGHKDEALAALQSELLTQAYIRDHNLLPILYWKDWDAAAQRWTTREPPTLWKANRFFKNEVRDVTEDRKSGLVLLKIRWHDPRLAAQWANDLVRITNNYLKTKAIDESERNIRYLNEQAVKTNVLEVQKAIYALLQDEINKEMVARGRDEYALKVVDPAFVPEKPSSAGPVKLGVGGFAFGLLLSALVLGARKMAQS